jgi:hypothetical protein
MNTGATANGPHSDRINYRLYGLNYFLLSKLNADTFSFLSPQAESLTSR